MSNEIIFEIKVENTAAVANLGKVQDAMVGFQQAVTLTASTMTQLNTAEKTLTDQTGELEKMWGLSYETMFDLQDETGKMIDVINKNADAFENNKAKAGLMKQSLQEQIDKYTTFGHEVPKSLEAVAVKYGVMASEAEKAAGREKKALENVKKSAGQLHGDVSTLVQGFKSMGTMVGLDAGIFDGVQNGLDSVLNLTNSSVDKVLALNEQFEDMGRVIGPVAKSISTSFGTAFKDLKSSGSGFFKSFKGGMSGLGTAMKTSMSSGMASVKGAWKGMSTGMKFSVGLVGAELVGKGIAALADAYSAACDREIAAIYKKAAVEKKAYDDFRLIRQSGDKELQLRMKQLIAEGRARGEDFGTNSLKVQKALAKEIQAIKDANAAAALHKKELGETTQAMQILTDSGLKNMNHQSDLMVEAIEKGTEKWGENRTMTESAKNMIQEQINKYEDLGLKIPANLQAMADKHGILTAKQQEWKEKTDAMKDSLGLLTNSGLADMNRESNLLVDTVNRNKDAFDGNSEAMSTMKDRIQEQLDKYQGYDAVPEKLQSLADKFDVVSTKQQAARDSAQSLLDSYGFLGKDALEKLNLESTAFVGNISSMTDAGNLNVDQQTRMKDAIQAQLDKYKDMENVPADLQALADKWGVMDSKTAAAKAALDDYDSSLGFLKTADVEKEMNNLTGSLARQEAQYKRNPAMIQPILDKIEEMRQKAIQTGTDMPPELLKQEAGLKTLKEKADLAASSINIYGVNIPIQEIKDAKTAQDELNKKLEKISPMVKTVGKMFGMSDKQVVKFAETTGTVGKTLSNVSKHGGEVVGFLKDTKIVSGETAEALTGLVGGIGDIGAGFGQLATNPIGGAMKILGGVVKTVTNIFKLFSGDGVGEAIDRERELIDITEATEQKIRDLEETLGDTHAATSMLMSEIIAEADINKENFADYAQRTRDILCSLDEGTLSIQQTQEAMGGAFNALLEDATRLGTEGSKEMQALLLDVRGRGLEVAEMQEYVNGKLASGAEALKTYLSTFSDTTAIQTEIDTINTKLLDANLTTEEAAVLQADLLAKQTELQTASADVHTNWGFMAGAAMSTFSAMRESGMSFMETMTAMGPQMADLSAMASANGIEISGGIKKMTDMAAFIEQNETLATRIEASNQMMTALGDSAFMTQSDFTNFSTNALTQFDQLIAAGGTEEQALMMIGPQLDNLIKYHEARGWAIDDETQKLINKAREEGALNNKTLTEGEKQIEIQERMADILGKIAEKFGVDIPNALGSMNSSASQSFANLHSQTGKWNSDLATVENRMRKGLPDAVKYLDREYTDKMTGHSIVTETNKWKTSLDDVDEKLGKDLVDTTVELDRKYTRVMGDGSAFKQPAILQEEPARYPEPMRPRHIEPYRAGDRDGYGRGSGNGDENTYNEYFIFENISLYTENGEDAVRDFMTAFKDNKLGVKSMIRKAVHQYPSRGV